LLHIRSVTEITFLGGRKTHRLGLWLKCNGNNRCHIIGSLGCISNHNVIVLVHCDLLARILCVHRDVLFAIVHRHIDVVGT
jgi:hypothetical protein